MDGESTCVARGYAVCKDSVGEIVRLVNELLEHTGRTADRIRKVEECNCDMVYSLYSDLFNGQVPARPLGVYWHCNNIVTYKITRRYQLLSTDH